MYIVFPELTLKAVINALHSVCPKWYNIGVQLEVPIFQLKIIEKKSSDLMDQLRDTLDYWMSNDPSPSWRHLVDALKAPSVSENRLAGEIEKKYCCPVEQSSCAESEVVQCWQGMYICMYVGRYVCVYVCMYYVCMYVCMLFSSALRCVLLSLQKSH